jgi:hypothetical protein
MQDKATASKPDTATVIEAEIIDENQNQTRLPREYERRWETGEELKAFIDQVELLRRLPISRRTLANWRTAGKIPSIVIGRRVLFCWENVSAALRRLEKGGGVQ